MSTPKKFWIVLIGAVLAMAIIACSCGSILPLVTPTPNQPVNPPPEPSGYDSLPYYDDFSSPGTSWDVFDTSEDSAGYNGGYYFVISRTNEFSSYGAAGRFYGDTVIEVDATPVNGPADNNFSFNVGCRVQDNDGYVFEVSADGYFAVGYYTGGGDDYTSMLSGDEWQFSNVIQQGMVTNHLTVTCAGNHLRMEVNGEVLFDEHDLTFTEGDISLGAATYDDNNIPAEVHFDNLAVTAP